jgi:predicted amidohydrolase YtcJ
MAALRAVTSDAYIDFNEKKIGTLEARKLADVAVLDRDYLDCPEEQIRHIKVMMTMCCASVTTVPILART